MDEELIQSRRSECANIVAQTRDAEALRDASIIDEQEYVHQRGLNTGCLRVLSLLDAGEWVDDARFAQVIAEETASVGATVSTRVAEVEEAVRVQEQAIVEIAEIVGGE